jgi:hypothetical protein
VNLHALLNKFRTDIKDSVAPYLVGTLDVLTWLADAEDEACIRGRLLFEDVDADFCEVSVLTGTREYAIDPRITEIVTAWLTDAYGMSHDLDLVTRTWLDEQNPNWRHETARRPTALMHLSKRIALDIEPDADYTLTQEIYRKPLVRLDARHAVTLQDAGDTVTQVEHGRSNGEPVLFATVNLTTGIEAEEIYYIRDAATDTYKLCAFPGGTAIALTTDGAGEVIYLGAEPEIEEVHHKHLIDWVLHRAFSVPDADLFNPGRSAEGFGMFELHFGAHPGANMRRQQNARTPRPRPTWC